MGRRKKNPSPPPDVSELKSSAGQENPALVEEQIDDHEPPAEGMSFSGLLDRARDNLATGITGEVPGKPRKKYIRPAQRDEIGTVVASLLTLMISAWAVPSDLKPNDEEINALASPCTGIILRHVNLSGRLTGDVLDAIGILAVVSGYYARTASAWRAYRPAGEAIPPRPRSVVVDRGNGYGEVHIERQEGERADPIADLDPNAAEFLNKPRGKHASG
jgi:hypothetical protein